MMAWGAFRMAFLLAVLILGIGFIAALLLDLASRRWILQALVLAVVASVLVRIVGGAIINLRHLFRRPESV